MGIIAQKTCLVFVRRHFVSFYRFATSALPPPWSKSFTVFIWSICNLPYLAPKTQQAAHCSKLSFAFNCCLAQYFPAAAFWRLDFRQDFKSQKLWRGFLLRPSEKNWVQFTKLWFSKLSVLNFFSSFKSSTRNQGLILITWKPCGKISFQVTIIGQCPVDENANYPHSVYILYIVKNILKILQDQCFLIIKLLLPCDTLL